MLQSAQGACECHDEKCQSRQEKPQLTDHLMLLLKTGRGDPAVTTLLATIAGDLQIIQYGVWFASVWTSAPSILLVSSSLSYCYLASLDV